MPDSNVKFSDMFACCCGDEMLARELGGSPVFSATVDKKTRRMRVSLGVPDNTAPTVLRLAEDAISAHFGLSSVEITPVYPEKTAAPKKEKEKKKSGTAIFGHVFRDKPVPMRDITLESGRIAVEGEVFACESKKIQKINAYVISFDMTDGTGSVHVSLFLRDKNGDNAGGQENTAESVAKSIEKGMYLAVQGDVGFDRYYRDVVLNPKNIVSVEKTVRTDTAPEKRVELHLHTQMSQMDALTNTKDVVKRAISWGHPAIAITDHGVCQSFPDAMSAAGDKIKVLYGVEGYFSNDVDDRLTSSGYSGKLPEEFVAFDIETTGLSSENDRITEIGAVIMRGNEEVSRFGTFVNPEMHIPANITHLTGITDDDVKDAPSQEKAVRDFLAFVGDRPLAAHNARFDIGFIWEAAQRYGIGFEPDYIDTLTIAQGFLPELKNHRLDTVSDALALPQFNHHRASDDALAAGRILAALFEMAAEKGIDSYEALARAVREKRTETASKKRGKLYHIILLAQTQAGIKNLYKIVTKSHLEHFRRYPVMPKSLILEHREGILIGSACEAGEIFGLISDHGSRLEQRRLAEFYDYLEIQPLCNNMFMLYGERPRASSVDELRDYNRRVIALGDELGKLTVATCDVHFLDPEQEIFRRVLLTAKEFEDADRELPLFFRTTDEMLSEFEYLGKERAFEVVVTNPRRIADMCDTVSPLPPKKLFPPRIENSAQQLKDLVYGRMHELYGDNPPEIVTERIETELDAILGRGYDVIYMSAQKLVADSLAHNYLVGSRGSVGSSLVAYMSGITEVNSLPAHYRCPKCCHVDFEAGAGFGCGADMPDGCCPKCGSKYAKEGFDIPFETFLGFGGDKVPDIDLNFSGEYQANAHKYTNELFGSDHVFRAGTIGTIAENTAHGYVRKYLEKHNMTVPKAEENRLAVGLVGVKRTTGQHPGGLVVIPQDMEICDFCPAQHPADDAESGIITTHFEYHCMEDNLLKLDELGHDDPTMIRMLEDMTQTDAKKIPLDDADTMGIFKSAAPLGLTDDDPIIGRTGTLGIPEFGTNFTRQMLVDTQPEKFNTLVRLSGFSHGTDVWAGNIRDIVVNKVATVDECVGCRDDIMLYLIEKGMEPKRAFKFMEAVRKGAIHKGKSWPDGIVEEMQSLSVPEWYIESCRKIQYLFPKAHAVAYVMMAFRIAWYKVHRPIEFYSAYFYRRSQKDSFDASIMLGGAEAVAAKIREIMQNPDATAKEDGLLTTLEVCYEFYKRGFEFLPIDLYKSSAFKFNVENGALRPPFVAVSGLGGQAALDLEAHRNDREIISVDDLSACCPKVSKTHIEQLKRLGALGDLPDSSQLSLF